jgi:hypothetical protein
MKVFNRERIEGMVNEFVETLPKVCLYCGNRCWKVSGYPHACRCSQCSAFFHRVFQTCEDDTTGELFTHTFEDHYPTSSFCLVEFGDGSLWEVCPHCLEDLLRESRTDEELQQTA